MRISNKLIRIMIGALLVPVSLYAGKSKKRKRAPQDVTWNPHIAKKRRIDEMFELAVKDEHEAVGRYLRLRWTNNTNITDDDGLSLLTAACSDGSLRVVQSLLKHDDIDVNLEDRNGIAPLHFAVLVNHDTTEMLLAHPNIDVNKHSEEQASPLHTTISWYSEVSAEPRRVTDLKASLGLFLNDERVDVNLRSLYDKRTPLQTAVECWPEVIPNLLNCPRLNLDTKGYKELPLLQSIFSLMEDGIVSEENGRKSLERLAQVRNKINLDEIDKDGYTAWDWARGFDEDAMTDETSESFTALLDRLFR